MGKALTFLSLGVAVVAVTIAVLHRLFIVNEIHVEQQALKPSTTILITGATSGIGLETTRHLIGFNATVIMAVRDEAKGLEVKRELLSWMKRERPESVGKIEVLSGLDLLSFEKVKTFANSKVGPDRPLQGLILNAGATFSGLNASADGFERTFQVNHLSQYLLARLLTPNLVKGAQKDGGSGGGGGILNSGRSRLVVVSSSAHYRGQFDPELYSASKGKGMLYDNGALGRYCDTKLLNIGAMLALHNDFQRDNLPIDVNALHPGFVVSSLDRDFPPLIRKAAVWVRNILGRQSDDGAKTQVAVVTHPKLNGVSGRYFEDRCINNLCQQCIFCEADGKGGVQMHAITKDPSFAQQVEEISREAVAPYL